MNAYIHHGRWVADCATPYCTEAHEVRPGVDFGCGSCGQTYPVRFPDNAAEIDAVLSLRLVPATRNWTPPETVADLVAENRRHAHEGTIT